MSMIETLGGRPVQGASPPADPGAARGRRDMRRLIGRVKNFDVAKGHGFLYFGDGSEDAMVRSECLDEHGIDRLLPETTVAGQVECRDDGRRRVHRIWAIDESTVPAALRERAARRKDPGRRDSVPTRAGTVDAAGVTTGRLSVKMYDAEKGWGFLAGACCKVDVFVHVSVVHAAGLAFIEPDQEYEVDFGSSDKGPCAVAIRPATPAAPLA